MESMHVVNCKLLSFGKLGILLGFGLTTALESYTMRYFSARKTPNTKERSN